jgi:hypothetical protein
VLAVLRFYLPKAGRARFQIRRIVDKIEAGKKNFAGFCT